MKRILIKNAFVVNEGSINKADVLLENGIIKGIDDNISTRADETINAEGKHLIPGIIDDQVHFREPGLTHKAEIYTEAKAAVAGGVTSFMEMPNTKPPTLSQTLLEDKYKIAAERSMANYSFFMGAANDNLEEVLKTNPRNVCGVKIFMGSSTGNMLVDNTETLERLFSEVKMIIATHCEDEATVRRNEQIYRDAFFREHGIDDIPIFNHHKVRNEEACYKSSSFAVELAKKYNTRLHILHISTAEELALFTNSIPLAEKRITAEVCVHHLFFDATQYDTKGAFIKCNPAIKEAHHKKALFEALLDNRLDIIATDHAPHTLEEKQSNSYFTTPSGLPLVQNSINVMLDFYHQGAISLERIVEKMCHAPAVCFEIEKRGFIREGYWGDLALIDLNKKTVINETPIFSKCGWTPFADYTFLGNVTDTFVSGHWAYHEGKFDESKKGERLLFNR